jgi:hypothetical protein
MKIVYGEIVDGRLILPPEALEILPTGTKLYMVTDPERGIVTVRAKDPGAPQNEEFLDALAKLNDNLPLDEYTAPVPESSLRWKKNDEGGQDASAKW